MTDKKSRNQRANGSIIALLTDFGTRDFFVGAMKGAILTISERAKIVDISHDIAAQDLNSAGFTLRACYQNFPSQTIFVAVVDPGVGSNRKAILVATTDYFFVAPDNGLLSFIFEEESNFRVYQLTNANFFAEKVSRTFHGRDIFAPVAAHLSNGVTPNELGAETENYICRPISVPRRISAARIEGEIIHIDRFGNLILNFKSEELPAEFLAEINGRQITKRQTYFAEAEKSELFMIGGSAGFLEIVAFRDSAARLLKASVGQKISVLENK